MHGLSWEPLCEPNFMYFCIKSCIGTKGKVGRCKAVVPVLLFVALWFILRGDLLYVLPFLCFSVLLALRSPRLGRES